MIELRRLFRSLQIVRVIALGSCAALLLVACGAGASDIEGKYYYKMGESAGQGMTIEILKDGRAVGTRPGGASPQEGTYRRDGDKVIVSLTGDGANLTYTVEADGNLSTMFYGTEKAVFVKQ